MSEITISIPSLHDIKHHVEVEVKINGERHLYNYRVEKFKWTEIGLENRVEGKQRKTSTGVHFCGGHRSSCNCIDRTLIAA